MIQEALSVTFASQTPS